MISIVIPVYNTEDHIQDCVNSIISQSYKDIEIILVDDGSKDKSAAICDTLATKDLRIHTYHKQNGGAASARKFGVEKSSGEWIMFVDSDDLLCTDCISKLAEIAETNKFDIVVGTLLLNNKTVFKHQISGKISNVDYICAILNGKTSIGPVAKLYRKQLFYNLIWETPKLVTQNEDLLMLITLANKAQNIFIAPDIICYNYQTRENSASKSKMSYDGWITLFSLIESQISSFFEKKTELRKDFFSYKINRIYFNVIRKGIFINPKDPTLSNIISESQNFHLTKEEKKFIHIAHSVFRQKVTFHKFNITLQVKRFIKSIVK